MLNETSLSDIKQVLDFWDKLSEHERSIIAENTVSVTYKRGETVYSAAKECVGVLIIKSGELRTYILSEEGKDISLYRLTKGEVCILSASCLIKNITFDVHIDAEQDSEVYLINAAVFSKLIEQNIYIENFSLRVAVDKFSDVMWAMEQILFMSLDRRLAIFLLDESGKTGSNDIKLTHEQIAKYMGSAREVVSRMVKYFAKEGIVEAHRGGIKILNKAKLKETAMHFDIQN